MIIRIAAAAALALAMTGGAHAASIEGKWRTQSGANATISKCGGAFCVKLTSGPHAGKQIGRVSGSGSKYSGSVTDPANGKTYSGRATVSGNSLKMSGCVAKILCKTQTWSRR